MKTRNQNVSAVIELSGKDGIFQIDKHLTLFYTHETKKSIEEIIPAMVKEVRKMLKQGEVSINVLSMDDNYKRYDEYRWFIRSSWSHPTLDTRKFNGYDFSDSEVITYDKETTLFKQFKSEFDEVITRILGNIPEEISFYRQEIDMKYPVSSEN